MVTNCWLKATQRTSDPKPFNFSFTYSIRAPNQIEFLVRSELEYEGKQNELGILGFFMLKEGVK
jgi:hypothetical protein